MRKDIKKFVREYGICQTMKHENLHPAGFLETLPVPTQPWTDIAMDFIDGLPVSHGASIIFFVIDKLTKHCHFFTLAHAYTAVKEAQVFFLGYSSFMECLNQ